MIGHARHGGDGARAGRRPLHALLALLPIAAGFGGSVLGVVVAGTVIAIVQVMIARGHRG